jgi:glutathionyl-hydroquinone reductase
MENDYQNLNYQYVDSNLLLFFECRQKRKEEYPNLEEFVDAYYWLQKGDDTKMNEYIAKCEAIKNKYPKPE